jgi:CubicO group peptidase (beta-lactamase class C family)
MTLQHQFKLLRGRADLTSRALNFRRLVLSFAPPLLISLILVDTSLSAEYQEFEKGVQKSPTAPIPSYGNHSDERGDIEKRRSFRIENPEAGFPRRLVRPGTNVWRLEKASGKTFSPRYTWNGRTNSIEDFCKRTFTRAMLVLKDGRIVYEAYFAETSAQTRFVSFSMAKSITSTLVGMAIEDGFIGNVGEPLTQYLPALKGSAFDGVTIKDALQMLSGVPFEWNVEPDAKIDREAVTEQRYRLAEGASLLKRKVPPGSKFIYSNMNTEVLGWLTENATRKRLATYLEERIWKPAGMEFDAVWLLDGPPEIGRELAAGLFCATLRDYGRFGLLMMNDGQLNGRRLISPGWIRSATKPDRPPIQYGRLFEGYPLGYGYHWWVHDNGSFQAEGVYGQYIYVSPKDRVVIVKVSQWPEPEMEEPANESYEFFKAAVEALK